VLGFWPLHTHLIKKIHSFRNWVCPILEWNGQQPHTNSSDCWTQFSVLHPYPSAGWWEHILPPTNCLLLSTKNNKVQTLECLRVTYYHQKALQLVQYFSNFIAPSNIDELPGERSVVGFALLKVLCLLLPLAASWSVWRSLLLVALVLVTLLNSLLVEGYMSLCIWEQTKKQHTIAWTSVKCLCNSHLISQKPYNYVS